MAIQSTYLCCCKRTKPSFQMSFLYFKKDNIQDIKKGINYITMAAKNNQPYAQYFVGHLYLNKNDIKESIHYFSLAANQNNLQSLYFLGLLYLRKFSKT